MSLHEILVAVHAAAATASLVAGVVVVTRRRLFDLYLATLVVAVAALAGAVGVAWVGRPTETNLLFAGLVVLGLAMVRCGALARSLRAATGTASTRFRDLVGFTLISLFDGFVIVAVLTRDGPAWLALGAAVAGVLVGRAALHRLDDTVGASPSRRGRTEVVGPHRARSPDDA